MAFNTNGFSNPVIRPSIGGGSMCISDNLVVSINTPGTKLLYGAPQDQMAVTESFVELFQVNSTFGADATAGGPSVISGEYSIFVKLCLPTGYATLSYDKLGVRNSDHSDPIQVEQATSQVTILHELIRLLQNGKLGGYRFDKVVGVGHSAGSTLTQGITTQYPQDFNAVILTGTSANAAYQSAVGIQFAFYRYPNFDENTFRQQVANKQIDTLGVLLTMAGIVAPSPGFTGPVNITNGQHDLVFCGGDCLYPTDQNAATLSAFYLAASRGSQTYTAAGAGHCIAAHKSGPDSFKHMVQFLQANKL
ncbi:hypothetical protein F5Y09DRAFT_344266 [Xylaria sp. FL1042]|nr:hypothetical protein F5Y09DRAFT_344266 [Xylaria sp. FL1042]